MASLSAAIQEQPQSESLMAATLQNIQNDSLYIQQQAKRSNIVEFYQNRSVLITGGSGFIGKVLIEKLLHTCPGIRHIFVLIRPKWNKQPQERLQELLKAPLFDRVRDEILEKRVIVVEGDVTQANLGLSEQNLLRIMNEVSVIYHSAATVKFDEPLKQSIAINIVGTKNIIEICRKIPQLAALVHVSTAYANCDKDEIDEHIYPVDMCPEKLIEMANWLDQDTLQELKFRLLGTKPNTYTYTKALAEWLLIKCAKDLPVVICRPSIVVASWKEPFSGWIDNVNGPTGIILGAGKGLIRSMYAQSSYVADLIPVDLVINLIITLGWFAHVYQNHKQLNDTTDSLSESLIGSGSSSGDESFDEFTDRITLLQRNFGTGEMAQNHDGMSNEHDNDNNNNNSNSSSDFHTSAYESDGVRMGVKSKDNNDKTSLDIYSNNIHLQQFIMDDGYRSATQSTDAKSIVSVSSSSSLINPPNVTSSIEITTSSNNQLHDQRVLSFVAQRRLAEQKHAAFEYKLKQFRYNTQVQLSARNLPEELADIPVFHCTSGTENPITWGRIQVLIMSILAIYPSIATYRYPCGSFTNNKRLDDFYRFTLHYIPGYIVDFITQLFGGKPVLVKIFKKFDQAANVLKAFTSKQWRFNCENRLMLINELMSDEDRRLFNCSLNTLDWSDFLHDYVLGVRQFMLKEPISNLEQARTNLKFVYYRNLSFQVLFFAFIVHYFITSRMIYSLY